MKPVRRIALVATLALLPLAALADQAPWGPVTGRTNTVSIDRHEFGDVHVSVDVTSLIPALSSLPIDNAGSCDGSMDYTCYGLGIAVPFVAPHPGTCTMGNLPAVTQAALTYVLGSCAKSCLSVVYAFRGERRQTDIWSCTQGPHVAECLSLQGEMTPGLRIEMLSRAPGCLF